MCKSKFGSCRNCGDKLVAVMFIEKESKVLNGNIIYTGRKRKAVDHLVCESCLTNECVDDSFDGSWYN